jgi:hypothetical protein
MKRIEEGMRKALIGMKHAVSGMRHPGERRDKTCKGKNKME